MTATSRAGTENVPMPGTPGIRDGRVPNDEIAENGVAPRRPSVQSQSKQAFKAVVLAAGVSSLTAATLGYDVGIVAAAIDYINKSMHLNHPQTELVVGSLNFISAFGTLIAGHASDALGRKKTVWICCALYVVGTALMALAPDYPILLVGRIVTGLGVGVSFVVVPVYISEITPSEYRGALSTCFDMSINFGIVLGYVIGFLVVEWGEHLSDDATWRVMLGLGAVLPIIVLCGLTYLPESPRWLMARGRREEAGVVLTRFLGDAQLAADTLRDIKKAMDEDDGLLGDQGDDRDDANLVAQHSDDDDDENEVPVAGIGAICSDQGNGYRNGSSNGNGHHHNSSNNHSSSSNGGLSGGGGAKRPALSWSQMLGIEALSAGDEYLRSVVLLVVGVGFWQQATGSEAVLYYSATFLEQAGLTSPRDRLLGYIALGFCKLLPEAFVMLLVDQVGRRPLLISSSSGVTVFIFMLSASFAANGSGGLTVALLCFYMVSFSIGMGPITWLIAAEMLPSRARAKGMTLCCFVNRLVSGGVALTALSTCDALGFTGFFALYGFLGFLGTVWYILAVPETKGKTLEEITAYFKDQEAGKMAAKEGAPKPQKHRESVSTTNPLQMP